MPAGKRTTGRPLDSLDDALARGRPVRVYAIVNSRSQTVRAGGAEALRMVRRGSIAAVVGDHPRSSAPTPTNLRRYDRTMRALAGEFPAILPARFGTSIAEDELLFILSSRQTALTRALKAVRGRVQMTIRVVAPGERKDDGNEGAKRSFSGASRGRDYLAGKARVARSVPGFAPIRRAVARWIRDERVEHRAGVSSVFHLIPRSSIDAYRRAVHTTAAATGVRLVISGPWPPYAFGAD